MVRSSPDSIAIGPARELMAINWEAGGDGVHCRQQPRRAIGLVCIHDGGLAEVTRVQRNRMLMGATDHARRFRVTSSPWRRPGSSHPGALRPAVIVPHTGTFSETENGRIAIIEAIPAIRLSRKFTDGS
jgi:hypothetical protein